MRKLTMSYNPYATDYVNCHCPLDDNNYDDATIQQDN